MRQTGRYIFILVIIMALWNTVIIKPIKLFAVFLHELGHSCMVFIFGKGISAFSICLAENSHIFANATGWFSSFMIANGGYLGSLVFALLIIYSKRIFLKNYIMGLLAILFLSISVLYAELSWTFLYSAIFAAVVILMYMTKREEINEWFIDVVGTASLAYAVYDIFIDTILLQVNSSFKILPAWKMQGEITDAMNLEKMTCIPAYIWGIVWLAIYLIAINFIVLKPVKRRR